MNLDFIQIVQSLNLGIMILDRDLCVVYWNRWLEEHSRLKSEDVVGKKITDLFPELEGKGFSWKTKTVFKMGNFEFFSQQLHSYLIPLQLSRYFTGGFEYMQQNATLSPLRGKDRQVEYVCVSIEDTTDAVMYRERLEQAKKEVEIMSLTDQLTELPNRRYLMDTLEREIAKHTRYEQPLSVAILDIDYFKKINDSYGHICGDSVLQNLAKIFPQILRDYDFAARYGGEEFCLLLTNTMLEGAQIVMDRLRKAVEAEVFHYENHDINLTVSIGISSNESSSKMTTDRLLDMADEALYKAKSGGRNRCVCYIPE